MKVLQAGCAMIIVLMLNACTKAEFSAVDAWVRTPPSSGANSAGYMLLRNKTATPLTVVAVSADAYANVTIHESRLLDGVWKMLPVAQLPIAAGAEISLEPGGFHLMLQDSLRSIESGEQISIVLHLADGRLVTVPALVHDSAP